MRIASNTNTCHIHLAFMMMLLFVTSCSRNKNIGIINSVHYSTLENSKALDKMGGCIEYDSVTFSDGSYAVMRMMFSPQNWLVRYVGKDGKLLATVSAASETQVQRLVYGYDEKGRLKYLLHFDVRKDTDIDGYDNDSVYLFFRQAIDSIDFHRPDLMRHIVSEVMYGDDGYAHEITERPTGKVIKAPVGYKLNINVDPCVRFWMSDLNGGYLVLITVIVPVSNGAKEFSIKRFVDFTLTIEEYYKNGRLRMTVCHPNPSYPDDVKATVIHKAENGADIYTHLYGSSTDTLIHIWKDGRLQEETLKSKWGTVLNKKSYHYLPSGEIKKEEQGFDFKSKVLKRKSIKPVKLSDIPLEKDEMNPLRRKSWIDVYGE